MVNEFKQLRKKEIRWAIFYAALLGICTGALAFGVLFTVIKLTESTFSPYLAALCAVGLGGLVCAVLLLFTYPTVRRFARKLDTTYALRERVQTMVEYSAKEGAITQLQREDTARALSGLLKKKKGGWFFVKLLLPPILAAAMVTTAFIVPKPKQEEPPIIPPPIAEEDKLFTLDEYQRKDLETLIANVEASALETDLRNGYLTPMRALLQTAASGEAKVGEVKASVTTTMQLIMTLTKEENSYNAFRSAMTGNATLKSLSRGLKESGTVYKGLGGVNIFSYSTLKKNPTEMYNGVAMKLVLYAEDVKSGWFELDKDGYIAYINTYVEALEGVLVNEGVSSLDSADGVKAGVVVLKTALADTLNLLDGGYSLDYAKGQASAALEGFGGIDEGKSAALALSVQAYNYMLRDYAVYGLDKIFGWGIPDEGEVEDDELGSGGGGGGTGETQYPSEGEILDPSNGQYRPYYELLDEYQAKIMQLLEEDAALENPQISEEVRAYLKAYFESLQTGN